MYCCSDTLVILKLTESVLNQQLFAIACNDSVYHYNMSMDTHIRLPQALVYIVQSFRSLRQIGGTGHVLVYHRLT